MTTQLSSAESMLGEELTEAEEREIAERDARRILGISFTEFEARWRAGEYRDCTDPRISHVAFHLT